MSNLPPIGGSIISSTRAESTYKPGRKQQHEIRTMDITVIYGKAGSGKSTILAKRILEAKDYYVLAPTNAAVENIYRMVCNGTVKEIKRDRFKTMYSFFRIDYETENVLGAIYYPSVLFVDEFGLMPKQLFKTCLNYAERGGVLKMIISGDMMQLSPIYEHKQYISLSRLRRLNNGWSALMNNKSRCMQADGRVESLYSSVIEHFQLSSLSLKKLLQSELIPLTVNRRANDITKQTLTAIYNKDTGYAYQFVEFFDMLRLINDEDYIFIASRYKILQHVYDALYERYLKRVEGLVIIDQSKAGNKAFYNRLYLTPGMAIIACQTVKNEYINGQELIFTGNEEAQGLKCIDPMTNEIIYIHKVRDSIDSSYYPISPAFLLSVHKAQGRSIDKVIVCIDEMFDISMLYTAVTRARNNLVFYSCEAINERVKKLIDVAHVDEFKQLNTIVKNIKVITQIGQRVET